MLKKIANIFQKNNIAEQPNVLQTLKINYIDIVFNDKVICRSFLNEITDNELICDIGNANICENATVQIILYTLCGDRYSFLCQIKMKENGKIISYIQNSTIRKMPERRSAVKVNTSIKGIIYLDPDVIEVDIKNISVGGVFISTTDDLILGLTYKFSIPEIGIVETPLTILRRQDDYSGYGCKFPRLEREYEDIIVKYTFEKQLEDRRKLLKKSFI